MSHFFYFSRVFDKYMVFFLELKGKTIIFVHNYL